jgi:hypothetical protein
LGYCVLMGIPGEQAHGSKLGRFMSVEKRSLLTVTESANIETPNARLQKL